MSQPPTQILVNYSQVERISLIYPPIWPPSCSVCRSQLWTCTNSGISATQEAQIMPPDHQIKFIHGFHHNFSSFSIHFPFLFLINEPRRTQESSLKNIQVSSLFTISLAMNFFSFHFPLNLIIIIKKLFEKSEAKKII